MMKKPQEAKRSWIVDLFNIRKGEAKPAFLLMLFSFFVGLTLSFYFTASSAIFLKHFAPRMIPVSYIASGIIVYAAWWILSRLDRLLSLPAQLISKFLFVFITVSLISAGVWLFDTAWLAFIMFTWIRVLVYITLVTFWGLAGKLFNIRQGKRIFGVIGIGEAISIIIGYFSIPLILKFLKAPDLLFLASASLLICLIVIFVILKIFDKELRSFQPQSKKEAVKEKSEWNYWKLLQKPYFRLISMMALLPIFGYLFVDFIFLTQTRQEFPNNPQAIANFLGLFLGFVAVVELILKIFSGRFLNKYGLKSSLLSLPAILVLSISLAAISGALYGTVGLFFAFIAMARLFERSVRGALYEPAFQILYQPLPVNQRLPFQNQIEGIPKALGTVLTGVALYFLSGFHFLNLVHLNWLFILVLAAWIWIAYKMYEAYRNILKSKLSQLKTATDSARDPVMDLICNTLTSVQPALFQQACDFFEKVEPAKIDIALQQAHKNASSPLKEMIAQKIEERTLAPDADEVPFEQLAEQVNSQDALVRLSVARLLGSSGRYNTYKLLIGLMKDPDLAVKKAAVISSGKLRRYELWPFIIENLVKTDSFGVANMALRNIGEPILADLDRFFDRINEFKEVQLAIIRIYESIGGARAIKLLREKINHPGSDVRYQVMLSLSNLAYHATPSEIPYIKDTLEELVSTIVWLLASRNDLMDKPNSERLHNAILQEIEEKKEQVLLLLSLLYESGTIRHIREHIESKDANAKIYALEIGDMMLDDEIKELFFPIFEDLPVQEKLNRFRYRFPQLKLTSHQRLTDIINKDYTKISCWTKACAIEMAVKDFDPIHQHEILVLLAANIVNPDPIIAELAAWLLASIDKPYYFDTLVRFNREDSSKLSGINSRISARERKQYHLIYEKILLLKSTQLFEMVPESKLVAFLPFDQNLASGENLSHSSTIKPADKVEILVGDGLTLAVSAEKLYESMTGDVQFMERYLQSFFKLNINKEYE